MTRWAWPLIGAVAALLAALPRPRPTAPDPAPEIAALAERIDRSIERQLGRAPAPPADPLTVLRRLSLALEGRIPSLEEIRAFEADPHPDRIDRAAAAMLSSPRFAQHFADRWARALAGSAGLPEPSFRGDRLRARLASAFSAREPYTAWAADLIRARGLWTGEPSTDFLTASIRDGALSPEMLAARTSRVFLGQRIDCAECHDHPFAAWKKTDFAGLAAFFAETQVSILGVREHAGTSTRTARVPFGEQWLPHEGGRRERLAGWLVAPRNRRFHRAAINRVFALVFGRPWIAPVDDLPDPPADGDDDALDLLAADYHGDLLRAVEVLVATRAFRRASGAEPNDQLEGAAAFAEFPLTPLRPEQVAGAILQMGALSPPDPTAQPLLRAIRAIQRRTFLERYIERDEDRPATVQEALFALNGALPNQLLSADLLSAAGRIARLARSDRDRLEALFLLALTRRPTEEEQAALQPMLAGGDRDRRIEDLLWALAHAPEASWNH